MVVADQGRRSNVAWVPIYRWSMSAASPGAGRTLGRPLRRCGEQTIHPLFTSSYPQVTSNHSRTGMPSFFKIRRMPIADTCGLVLCRPTTACMAPSL